MTLKNSCGVCSQRNAGILMPSCPPSPEIDLAGAAQYYLLARGSNDTYKATYDCLFD